MQDINIKLNVAFIQIGMVYYLSIIRVLIH